MICRRGAAGSLRCSSSGTSPAAPGGAGRAEVKKRGLGKTLQSHSAEHQVLQPQILTRRVLPCKLPPEMETHPCHPESSLPTTRVCHSTQSPTTSAMSARLRGSLRFQKRVPPPGFRGYKLCTFLSWEPTSL